VYVTDFSASFEYVNGIYVGSIALTYYCDPGVDNGAYYYTCVYQKDVMKNIYHDSATGLACLDVFATASSGVDEYSYLGFNFYVRYTLDATSILPTNNGSGDSNDGANVGMILMIVGICASALVFYALVRNQQNWTRKKKKEEEERNYAPRDEDGIAVTGSGVEFITQNPCHPPSSAWKRRGERIPEPYEYTGGALPFSPIARSTLLSELPFSCQQDEEAQGQQQAQPLRRTPHHHAPSAVRTQQPAPAPVVRTVQVSDFVPVPPRQEAPPPYEEPSHHANFCPHTHPAPSAPRRQATQREECKKPPCFLPTSIMQHTYSTAAHFS